MSEFAYDISGEPFEVPAGATAWRVRRLKAQRGAPEVLYGADGAPLSVSIDADMDELRAAVNHTPGRYRLEPVDDDGKGIDGAPSGYVYVHPTPGTGTPNLAALHTVATLPPAPTLPPASASVAIEMLRMYTEGMREALRQNAQIASAVVAAFPSVMGATSTVLAAADGAGMPARLPRVIDAEAVEAGAVEVEPDETGEEEEAAGSSPLVQFGDAIAAQLMPLMPFLVPAMVQKLGGVLGVPVTVPSAPVKPKAIAPALATVAPSVAPPPTLDPAALAKLGPLYMHLSPSDQMRAAKLALELSAAGQSAFVEQLAELPPETALAKVRSLIGTDALGAVS